ncbi:MAG TPA: neutral/alkaline non-lysosomal ceramidase N-terminal domain-containing protein [Phycisphaerae bacterium]|nr:neutral/alkaline non-lysosomal ceramidase N-terminal domain-containing protein [Phycisphaerae bacterium]HRY66664.1 neutral/alkaline non-lysosomal ceramidase N-terminal domain-containing protein [Phycisphaerae bacterium]HSA27633.1 neutral/alkaline non-lysosomal ceramidase N-terminal domain-containing protein [Phycisphaerae bacterium]
MRNWPLAMASLVLGMAVVLGPARAADNYRMGAASEVITPKVAPDAPPVWLAGYGPGRQAEAVHDDIYARATVISDGKYTVAIVACDLIGLFREDVLRIRKDVDQLQLKPPIDYVLVSSTHTHAGPDTVGLWGPIGRTGVNAEHLKQVRAACVEVTRHAHAAMRPATLRIAHADVNEMAQLIGDSRQPIVIDSQLTVVQAKDETGRVIVTWVNMPCHPEVLGSRNKQLSSDFPSTERKHLEEKFGGTAIHNTGTVGGLLAPREPKTHPITNQPIPTEPIEQMMAYGRLIGTIAERALAKSVPLAGPIRADAKELLIPLWNPMYRLGAQMSILRRQVFDEKGERTSIPATAPAPATPDAASADAPRTAPTGPEFFLKTEVARLTIGDLEIAAIPGEIYPELTLGKIQAPQDPGADFQGAPQEPSVFGLMRGQHRMLVGLANDEIGYILPKSQWDWVAPYAYGRKDRQYGEANSCGPEAGPRIMAAWAALVKDR